MKKRIDLFSQRISSKELIDYLRKVRIYALYGFIGLLCLIVILSSVYLFITSVEKKLTEKRSTYNRFIVLNTPFVQDLRRFAVKFSLLKTMLKDDARSYAYYTHLAAIVSLSPVQGEIKDFRINNLQETEFSLRFKAYDDAINFIEYSERPAFLEYFTRLTVNEFTIDGKEEEYYDLVYSGVFEPLP